MGGCQKCFILGGRLQNRPYNVTKK